MFDEEIAQNLKRMGKILFVIDVIITSILFIMSIIFFSKSTDPVTAWTFAIILSFVVCFILSIASFLICAFARLVENTDKIANKLNATAIPQDKPKQVTEKCKPLF